LLISVHPMDLAALAGQSFGPHRFEVGGANIADFVDVTGDDPLRWETIAPPGFAAAGLFIVADELLRRLTDLSVIHGEQTFTWERPMEAGSRLDITGVVSKARERSGIHFVGFDLTMADATGVVASGSSLFLISPVDPSADRVDERAEPDPLEDGRPAQGQVSASRSTLVRYAAATRDWNPIHWDHDTAVSAGQPGVVVHGLLQAAWAFAAASKLRPGDLPLRTSRVRFRSPLPPALPVDISVSEGDTNVDIVIEDQDVEYLSARVVLADR
jgi:acyl dehydratase